MERYAERPSGELYLGLVLRVNLRFIPSCTVTQASANRDLVDVNCHDKRNKEFKTIAHENHVVLKKAPE